ncbi:hypothetical protein E5329_11550 [Petralouisia muris]|jgi:tellurite resistance protein TehA-like permease|uniref:Uncharacterized protein n=1 Tax=Petralouisia muris TaxID=3032872 RepID=A0AC61RWV5_9FIRM|nr:DUF4175 domain-containing protein [Petralouisia muris]MCI8872184.1 DUF4175 domain-containing protein [Lachnospiraceae bacterium]TGY96097.1 hypothetical protein E5329_11550 [Petralouisia muris]
MKSTKLIAPVIITVILMLFLLSYFFLWTILPVPAVIKIVFLLALLALMGVSVYNLVERIQEIRSGEEDDLSKY